MVPVVREAIAQIKELTLEFSVGGQNFRIWIYDDVAVATIDDHRIPVLGLPQNAGNAADRRNAAAAGNNCSMAGLAASLGDNAVHWGIAQHHDLAGQEFIRDDNGRAGQRTGFFPQSRAEVATHTLDYVANISNALFQVVVS